MSGARFVAGLPMYALPEMRPANEAFWGAIAAELVREGVADVPGLSHDPPEAIGGSTLFTQNCSFPLQTLHAGRYRVLGMPSYAASGCGAGTHRALILVRERAGLRGLADLRGGVFAMNGRHSNTGMNLPRRLFADLAEGVAWFGSVMESGSHVESMARVRSGAADAASVDCVTYAFVRDHRPEAVAGLRVLAETEASPALPFVTSAETPPDVVAALQRALSVVGTAARHRAAREGLRIAAIVPPDAAGFRRVLEIEREAVALGYPVLR